MVGRIRGLPRAWRERSKIERVELQSVAVWHGMPWLLYLSWGSLPLGLGLRPGASAQALGWALIVTGALQCLQVNHGLRRGLDHYLGRAPLPARDIAVSRALMVLALVLAFVLEATDSVEDGMIGPVTAFLVIPHCDALAFAYPLRQFGVRLLFVEAFAVGGFAAAGVRDGRLLGVALLVAFGAAVALFSTRGGAWTLAVMWEADRAREVEARLAVAEERLRFGRDLHDVMGRNLAVIALKSELAVQLARRERPEAVDQMVEVQRIAQQCQREIREVVRGYREAELGAELTGAQGVLEAAGIVCRVTGPAADLPLPVRSALAWVVREGTTNVLRHGDARHCAITLELTTESADTQGYAELTIENDGAPESGPAPGGSGLAGLRERLTAVDGTLEHTTAGRRFRLTARIPLPAADTGQADTGQAEAGRTDTARGGATRQDAARQDTARPDTVRAGEAGREVGVS
ncbi:sensor histidine kinase [Streptomyces sp. G45]|uniref:sensor histidine kinase n=1 Tax=Streptomyces sp. G45 TaxID=3406627 RepID=UPI003C1516A0